MSKGHNSGANAAAASEVRRPASQPAGQLALSLMLAAALHAAAILGFELAWRQNAPQPALAMQASLHFLSTAAPAPGAQDAAAFPEAAALAPAQASTEALFAPNGSEAARQPSSATPAMRLEAASAPAARLAFQEAAPDPAEPHPLPDDSAAAGPPPPEAAANPRTSPALLDLPYDALIRQIAIAHGGESQPGDALRPRTKRLASPSAASLAEAAYLNAWRQKVERIGRANHPGGNLKGQLRMLVLIRYDGALLKARILQSSGHPALDEAALRIVRLAAPYAQFPVEMRKAYDQLEITRSWQFSRAAARLNA